MKTKTKSKITPFQISLLQAVRDGANTGRTLAETLWPMKKRGKLAQAGRWQAAGVLVNKLAKTGHLKVKPSKNGERPIIALTAKGQKALAV